VGTAIDDYLAAMRAAGSPATTISSYFTVLVAFADTLPRDTLVQEITIDHVRAYLLGIAHQATRTRRHRAAVLRSFLRFLHREGHMAANLADRIDRPRAPSIHDARRSADLTAADVQRLLGACQTWREAVTFALLAYTGVRRHAAAFLRWRDVDLAEGTYTVTEKGDRVETRPMPEELADLLDAAHAAYDPDPAAFVIPPSWREAAGQCARNDRIVYFIVRTVADRAGVRCHPHALRGAFAVKFLTDNPGQILALKELLGHKQLETTQIYVERMEHDRLMQPVRSLSWAPSPVPGRSLTDDTRRYLERAKRSAADVRPSLPDGTGTRATRRAPSARDDHADSTGCAPPRRGYGKSGSPPPTHDNPGSCGLAPDVVRPVTPVRLLLPGGKHSDVVRHDGWAW
jgi:site-specific recombinase XerD